MEQRWKTTASARNSSACCTRGFVARTQSKAQMTSKPGKRKLKRKEYERELRKLQTKLVEMQEWVRASGARLVVLFEGRDAAGKGGVIHRIMERVSPRIFRHLALPAPTDREKTQMYAQRYVQHLPAAGEVVLFDRSWYNRALVEHVMEFATEKQYQHFLKMCPGFEESAARRRHPGEILVRGQQGGAAPAILDAHLRSDEAHWKLSPMDLKSHRRWYDYSRARCRVPRHRY